MTSYTIGIESSSDEKKKKRTMDFIQSISPNFKEEFGIIIFCATEEKWDSIIDFCTKENIEARVLTIPCLKERIWKED